jgi:small-conductance mechanosensitive channel
LIVVGIVRFLQRSVVQRIKETDSRYRVRKFVSFLGYILGIIVIITVFSDKLGGLTVALGVAGAGIAFALQEVIASIAGWFAISFANFYKTGDRVQLGGIKGDVIDIGILRTTLMEVGEWVKGDLYNGRMVRIANSFVFKEPVFNYSGDFPFLWDEITVPVKYGSNYQLARELLQQISNEIVGDYAKQAAISWRDMVKKYMIEDASVEPMVTMIANDNWVEFTIRYVVDYKKRRSTKDIIFTRIIEAIEKTDGKISLASATFELVGIPDLNVRTRKT